MVSGIFRTPRGPGKPAFTGSAPAGFASRVRGGSVHVGPRLACCFTTPLATVWPLSFSEPMTKEISFGVSLPPDRKPVGFQSGL
jgi:hypothetical protein